MYYPKIETLFKRGDDFNVTGIFTRPEFGYVKDWLWMEKLDGANISIKATKTGTHWRGRTSKANFIPDIQNHLNLRCEAWVNYLDRVLSDHKLDSIELFGEVYGPKIQNGGIYRDDITTKFYDIRVNENLWLDWDSVLEYSAKLDFDVPAFDFANTDFLVEQVMNGFQTFEHVRDGQHRPSEGIVAKTSVPLYNNAGKRLIWKLKTKDFTHGK